MFLKTFTMENTKHFLKRSTRILGFLRKNTNIRLTCQKGGTHPIYYTPQPLPKLVEIWSKADGYGNFYNGEYQTFFEIKNRCQVCYVKKKKLFPDLLKSWYLFELLNSLPTVKTSKNVEKVDVSKSYCDKDQHFFRNERRM